MKSSFSGLLAAALLIVGSYASADEVKSGLEAGAPIPAFNVVKVGGADADGVAVGKELCYRCKYGARPQVMIFTRTTGGEVVNLTKELNAAVAANSDKQLSAFVNVLSDDKVAAEKSAKELAAGGSAKVPVVVPVENANGPANYGINPDAEVTVLIASGKKVVLTHGYAAGKFDAAALKTVLSDIASLVK